MNSFTRTSQGQINQFRFYSTPVVWVEGESDVPVLNSAIRDMTVRLLPAGGKINCHKLIKAMKESNHPYVVVTDGDYDILDPPQRLHRRVVMLKRHSIENYFFEKSVCERVCRIYACDHSGNEYIGKALHNIADHLQKSLQELVVHDIARHMASGTDAVFPNRIESLLKKQDAPYLDMKLVEMRATETRSKLPKNSIKDASNRLDKYLANRRFVDVIRGHLLFGILRLLLSKCLRSKGKPRLSNDNALRALLASEMWQPPASPDHKALRLRLRRAVNEVSKLLATN